MRILFSLCCILISGCKECRIPPICWIRGRLINHSRHLRKGGLPLHVLSRMRFFCYVTNAYIFLICTSDTVKFIFLSLKSRKSCVYRECLFENSMSLYTYITRQNRPQHNVIAAFFLFFCTHYYRCSKPEPAFVNTRTRVWVTTPPSFSWNCTVHWVHERTSRH